MKLKDLIENCEASETLTRAVVAQLGGWDCFVSSAPDIANHGIDGGFGAFCYYSDTVPFAEKHRADIATMAEQQAESLGTDVLDMVRHFGCLCDRSVSPPKPEYSTGEIARCLYGSDDDTQIMNALAWYAGEEVARAYADQCEMAA